MSRSRFPGQWPPAPQVLDAAVEAAPLLRGRVLVHENARYIPRARQALDDDLGGVVMTGDKADERAFALRADAGYAGAVLIDTAAYKTHIASPDEPFLLPADEMFASVDTSLAFQKARGASAALTPTGYIAAADAKSLKAVARAASSIERADTVVTLPIDVTWLADERIGQLIAVCERITHPKALVVARQFDPLEHSREVPRNLRRVMSEVEDMMLLRTDLAALDAMAHGALCAGIGIDSSVRHSVPAGERSLLRTPGGPQYPSVLMPDLMCFKGAQALANRYANAAPATCDCEACSGRGLDRFLSSDGETRRESEDHNLLTWTPWVSELKKIAAGDPRKAWWRDKCAEALERYPLENLRLGLSAGSSAGFTPPTPLKAWATLSWAS
jgi:hypothetical protein